MPGARRELSYRGFGEVSCGVGGLAIARLAGDMEDEQGPSQAPVITHVYTSVFPTDKSE